ncbi:hypothetical protein P171DRAFT_438690 [Karstenula rhodostoma CBS 690.94]|uniref:RING-type domain-containing protein n=1 Tax=Karstenula rhodostoma CBS 690.94 TaxID=1392251 RepID=A0A9P4UK73_9PLEO|nr:hypothetical protein P171DRAFT_438690 [Karstenula rhodostoma CBS 690.94]
MSSPQENGMNNTNSPTENTPLPALVPADDLAAPQDRTRTGGLPLREHFVDPANGLLLPLTDPRTEARPQDVCAICWEPMDNLSEAEVITSCGHIYHRGCLRRWFENRDAFYGTCPMDRARLFRTHLSERTLAAREQQRWMDVSFQGRVLIDGSVADRVRLGASSAQIFAELEHVQDRLGRLDAEEQRLNALLGELNRVSENRASRAEQTAGRTSASPFLNGRIGTEQIATASDSLFHGETPQVRLPRPRPFVRLSAPIGDVHNRRSGVEHGAFATPISSSFEDTTEASLGQTSEMDESPHRVVWDHDNLIRDRNRAIQDRNLVIEDLDRTIEDLDNAIRDRNRAFATGISNVPRAPRAPWVPHAPQAPRYTPAFPSHDELDFALTDEQLYEMEAIRRQAAEIERLYNEDSD